MASGEAAPTTASSTCENMRPSSRPAARCSHQRRNRADHRVAGDGIAKADRRHELRAAFRHQPPQRLALQKLHRARLEVDDLEQKVRRAARRCDHEVEAVGGPRAALPKRALLRRDRCSDPDRKGDQHHEGAADRSVAPKHGERDGERVHAAALRGSTGRPCSSVTSMSASAIAFGSWLTMTTVLPARASSRIVCRTVAPAASSSEAVGSSASTSGGSKRSARAIATRCRSPRDSISTERRPSGTPSRSRSSRPRAFTSRRERAKVRGDGDVGERRQLRQEMEILEDEADALAPPRIAPRLAEPVDVDAVEPHRARIGRLQAREHVEKRRFAGSGRPAHHRHGSGRRRKARQVEDGETIARRSRETRRDSPSATSRGSDPLNSAHFEPDQADETGLRILLEAEVEPAVDADRPLKGAALIGSSVRTRTMSSGHCASVSQKGQTAIGERWSARRSSPRPSAAAP